MDELLGPDRSLPVSIAQSTARAWDTPGVHQHLPLLPSPACPSPPPRHSDPSPLPRGSGEVWQQCLAMGWGMHRGPAALWPSCLRIWPHSPFPPTPDILTSIGGSRGQQHPGASVSIICSSLPVFLCQCPCPGSSSRSHRGCCLPGNAPAVPQGRGSRAAPAAAGHVCPGHCTTIGFASALPFTAWKLNCKMSKTFPNCAILAWFY